MAIPMRQKTSIQREMWLIIDTSKSLCLDIETTMIDNLLPAGYILGKVGQDGKWDIGVSGTVEGNMAVGIMFRLYNCRKHYIVIG